MKNIEEIVKELSEIKKTKKRLSFLNKFSPKKKFQILSYLPHEVSEKLLTKIPDEEIQEIINKLDPDEATDLLQLINEERRKQILSTIEEEKADKIKFLLRFDEDSAAGVMDVNYIVAEPNSSFKELYKEIERFQEENKTFPIVFSKKNDLVHELPFYVILEKEASSESINNYLKELPAINFRMPKQEVLDVFLNNPQGKSVVLDKENQIIGYIRSEDVLKIAKNQQAENLIGFAGVKERETSLDSPIEKVRNRYKWLILNLGTAFLAASIVGLFQETISAFVLLAVYMPIVAGMGGNAGTQTLAVVVRGLVLNEIEFESGKKVILNELIAGAINGSINGVLIAIIAYFWNNSPLLGLVLAVSMIINLAIAGFFGALIPMILEKIGYDPATSATIFITTATDVLGFLVFLGLATLILVP